MKGGKIEMKKIIGKTVLFALCVIILGSLSIMAQPQPTWQGVHSLLPKSMYWSATCTYNGKIYVFGGNENDGEVKTTYIYDIATDTWSQGADMPTGRYLNTAVEVGGKIYVMGGRQLTASTSPVNANECYDPATDSWTTKAAMPNTIRGHAAVAANGKIYVMGGNTGAYTDVVSIYDPASNSWSNGPKLPAKVAYGGAAYSPSKNAIYFVGGVKSNTPSSSNFVGKIFALNLSTNTWDSGTAMTYKTAYFGCTANADGSYIYIVGGMYWTNNDEYPFPGIQVFNTSNSTIQYLNYYPSPLNRAYCNAVFENGSLWVLEGMSSRLVDEFNESTGEWYEPIWPINDGTQLIDLSGAVGGGINGKFYVAEGAWSEIPGKAYEYDPASNNWSAKYGVDPTPRMYVSGEVWNDQLVIYGGMNEAGSVLGTATLYDPLADTFTPIGSANPKPTLFEASAIYNNKLYLFGGRTDPQDAESLVNYTNILDLTSGTWSTGADLPFAIEQATAVAYNNKIYIFSGIDNAEPDYLFEKVLIYDPAANAFTQGASLPFPVYAPNSFEYGGYIFIDSGYNLYYNDLLGGLSGGLMSDMQVFNPSTSTFTTTPRPFGKIRGAVGVVGTKYFSTTGEDIDWPVERLDIASFGGGGCTLTCSASANPTSGEPPLTVNFTATANASGCTGTPTFSWNFGDGATSTDQNPSHTYQAEGTYNWSLTVTVDNQTCTKSGKITVSQGGGCVLTCDASASPASGTAPLAVTFTATETHEGCTGTPTFAWNFGDGETSTEQNPSHTYTTAGSYNWTLTVSVDGQTCSKTGTVTVTGGQQGPTITSVSKATNPFRLIVLGNGFKDGCVVHINGNPVPSTKFKSSTKVVAKKGATLKAMCPKGVTVKVTVQNPDGSTSNEYNYTR